MQFVLAGSHSSPSTITMLPLIDMKPSDETCVYSTLLFVHSQARKVNMPSVCITLDQPLWLKAVEISRTSGLNVVVRLGSFHLLMSFLGSIGKVMLGSGFHELMELVYGADTVQHMLSGKAVARALRAHLLIQSALMTVLLKRILPPPDQHSGPGCVIDSELSVEDYEALSSVCATVTQSPQTVDYSGVLQSTAIAKIADKLTAMKHELSQSSRTAKLWIHYIHYVDVIMYTLQSTSFLHSVLETGTYICRQFLTC